MLIPVKVLRRFWKVTPSGVVHVGAHSAEELSDYESYGFGPVVWVEAQPNLVSELKMRVQAPSEVLEALVWDKSGERMSLKVTNNGQSSSVFEFGTHVIDYPEIEVVDEISLSTKRLDEILPRDFHHNFLNIDIQGAEYQALKGLGLLIARFSYIYLEVNRGQVYHGINQVVDIDSLLGESGFLRVATVWTSASWGDALYIKRDVAEKLFGGRLGVGLRIALFGIFRNQALGNLYRLVVKKLFSIKSR